MARRSVAITGAPFSLSTPVTVAVPPCTSMRAPIRISSGACMKRFSKMCSSSRLTPSARVRSAIICACRSVGKPGNGSVATSTALTWPFIRRTLRPALVAVTSMPASSSLSAKAPTRSRRPPISSTSPPVIAGASM